MHGGPRAQFLCGKGLGNPIDHLWLVLPPCRYWARSYFGYPFMMSRVRAHVLTCSRARLTAGRADGAGAAHGQHAVSTRSAPRATAAAPTCVLIDGPSAQPPTACDQGPQRRPPRHRAEQPRRPRHHAERGRPAPAGRVERGGRDGAARHPPHRRLHGLRGASLSGNPCPRRPAPTLPALPGVVHRIPARGALGRGRLGGLRPRVVPCAPDPPPCRLCCLQPVVHLCLCFVGVSVSLPRARSFALPPSPPLSLAASGPLCLGLTARVDTLDNT